MGKLVEGVWHDVWYDTGSTGGKFVRADSSFRNWITADGSPGPAGSGGFKAESGRYHLYVSLACPWAHRTLLVRQLKGLQDVIDYSVVHPHMLEQGWPFQANQLDAVATLDPLHHKQYLHEIYTMADPRYTGRVTVPVLWDKTQNTIVSNESSEIIRMLNTAFAEASGPDLYPEALRPELDAINARVYDSINNGVYKAGFATSQAAYAEAYRDLFSLLDELEALLDRQRYLVGAQFTEADVRLFTTLIRFDAVYYGHFKCNRQPIADFPNLSGYLREIYQMPGVAGTTNFLHIKQHYYYSHASINPHRIVPLGPLLDLEAAHNRDRF